MKVGLSQVSLSRAQKYWHFWVDLAAALLFFLGAFPLFPCLLALTEGTRLFAWMYLAASTLMAAQTVPAFLSYGRSDSKDCSSALTLLLGMLGWLCFLAGSVLGSPWFDLRAHRDLAYLAGAT
jgi:hypothetical protein